MPRTPHSNDDIAALLGRIADLLEAKGENPFRVRSYRNAAHAVRESPQSVARLVRSSGAGGAAELQGVGERIGGLIREFVEKGNVELLQSLEKEIPPEKIKEKANRHEGRTSGPPAEIPVALLLEMDAEYREKAAAGKLKKIAPKKLNPGGKAWLPLLAAERTGYRFTLMFSNTALAHELGKTNDWVVIYYEKGKGEGQCTVVSEKKGGLKGKRVVRGREEECLRYYGQRAGGKP